MQTPIIPSNNVLEAEGAVAGEAFPLAPPAEVLAVGPLGVHVAQLHGAGAPRLLAALRGEAAVGALTPNTAGRGGGDAPYLAGDVLHAVRVVGLLAGPAELAEIDLGGGRQGVSFGGQDGGGGGPWAELTLLVPCTHQT